MKQRLRLIAVLTLALFLPVLVPAPALADDIGVVCGDTDQGPTCAVIGRSGQPAPGSAAGAGNLSPVQFAAIWYFVILSWYTLETIMGVGAGEGSICQNCAEGWTGTVVT